MVEPGFEHRQSGSKACMPNLWASYTSSVNLDLEHLNFTAIFPSQHPLLEKTKCPAILKETDFDYSSPV